MENRESCFSYSYISLSLQGERDKYNLTTTPLQNLFIHFSKFMFKLSVKPTPRTSTAVEAIQVDPLRGTVVLRFLENGYEYKYSNVSRLKIINLLMQPNMSLGFWVYNNLSKVGIQQLSYTRGNTLATGKLCYQFLGAIYSATAALPC